MRYTKRCTKNLSLYSFLILWFLFPVLLFAQEIEDADRESYLTEQGYIIPPDEIRIETYITQVDYNYPLPLRDPINVITAADIKGNTAYVQIGLKGRKVVFQELPPMNIAFVIDKSGSMLEQNRMDWVKDSLYGFIEQVREQDIISLIVFDTSARVLIAPTQISTDFDKQEFISKVDSIRPSGGTNIYEGMFLGYNQVSINYRQEYINQIICLTDGVHNSGGKNKTDIFRLVENFRKQDIMASTIALGTVADVNLMVDIALKGGGNSRFVSEQTDMVESFGTELDRLVISAATQVKMELRLAPGVTFKETWGYKNRFINNTVHYAMDTMHNGACETIVAEVQIKNLQEPTNIVLGNFYLEYLDQSKALLKQGPYPIVLGAASIKNNTVLTDPRIKEAEGFIVFGKGMISIGNQALEIYRLQGEYNALRNQKPDAAPSKEQKVSEHILPPELLVKNQILKQLSDALQYINELSVYLVNIRNSLGEKDKYQKELQILKNYYVSFSQSYELSALTVTYDK